MTPTPTDDALRFWLSWVQPTEDYRPLTYPPNAAILGWWCSGYDNGDRATLGALVEARSERDAKRAVHQDWPEATGWRFVEERPSDWLPGDRFPLDPWMQERLA